MSPSFRKLAKITGSGETDDDLKHVDFQRVAKRTQKILLPDHIRQVFQAHPFTGRDGVPWDLTARRQLVVAEAHLQAPHGHKVENNQYCQCGNQQQIQAIVALNVLQLAFGRRIVLKHFLH